MKCPGIHCPGCKGGGGAGFAIVGALALALAASKRQAIGHAAGEAWHVVVMIAEVIALTAAGIAALALAYGGTRVALWARARARARGELLRERAAVPPAVSVPLAGRVIAPGELPAARRAPAALPAARRAPCQAERVPARARTRQARGVARPGERH